ncbi:SH3 domain protein [Trypanosoma cruzi]|nr:SH3 domain protein [Trypanosoma cruzi]RNC38568.1 SH3 domain protein [Trypanosoma cruzi]
MRTTSSRGWPGLSWIDGGPDNENSDRYSAERAEYMDKRRPLATCAPKKSFPKQKRTPKNGERPPAADEGGRRRPNPFRHPPPNPTEDVAPHRRRPIRSSKLPNAIDEEGERGGSRDVGAANAGAENASGGAIHSLSPHARTADQRGELCGPFLWQYSMWCRQHGPQHARMLRSMLRMDRTPLDMVILGLQKLPVRSEKKLARPLTKKEMHQVIRSRTDWKDRFVLRLAWITASRWSEVAALTPNNFTPEPDGTLIFDWSVAPRTAKADPHRASRFFTIRGQDAFDTLKLCRTLQENKKLTNLTNAQVERALVPWDATAHSIKRGALRHGAQIVETHNLDPHVISQLAKHFDPLDPPQNAARYLRKHTAMPTQALSLAALM